MILQLFKIEIAVVKSNNLPIITAKRVYKNFSRISLVLNTVQSADNSSLELVRQEIHRKIVDVYESLKIIEAHNLNGRGPIPFSFYKVFPPKNTHNSSTSVFNNKEGWSSMKERRVSYVFWYSFGGLVYLKNQVVEDMCS